MRRPAAGLSPTLRYCVISPKARGGAGAAAGGGAASGGATAGAIALHATAASAASVGATLPVAVWGARWTNGQLSCVHCDPAALWRHWLGVGVGLGLGLGLAQS